MNLGALPERNAEIVRLFEDGGTLQSIGDRFGLTRERVRQIVDRAGARRPADYAPGRVERTAVPCSKDGCDVVMELVPYWAKRRQYCSRECRDLAQAVPHQDAIKALRSLADRLGHTPTQADMNADPDTPYHMTYVRKFGSIREAQRAAGLTPNKRGGFRRASRNGKGGDHV